MKKIVFFLFVFIICFHNVYASWTFMRVIAGNRLYFEVQTSIINGTTYYNLRVTYPCSSVEGNDDYWNGYVKPTGNLIIPDSIVWGNQVCAVKYIDYFAFRNCTGITSVSIPATVVSIFPYAFTGCPNITSYYFSSSTPPNLFSPSNYNYYLNDYFSINYNSYNSARVFFVPCGSASSYQSAWNTTFPGFTEAWTPYSIVGSSSNIERGQVETDENICGPSATFTAIANHGYHFSQWNDGNTDNPRTITLIQDTAFTAYFDRSSYNISVLSNNTAQGTTSGNTSGLYLDSVTFSAIANYGYHFSHWNDGNTNNPRIVQVSDDATYTAYFDYDQFTITVQSDNTTLGNVSGGGSYSYLSNRTITATANYGYHFTQWNDGNTDNPRTLSLTQDTAFTAIFVNPEGIEETPPYATKFLLLPNPAGSEVRCVLHGTNTTGGTLTLVDATGHEILRQTLPTGATETILHVETLPNGVYYVTLTTSQGTSTQKLVVER